MNETEVTYALVSRAEEGVRGWLAVGVGHQMKGGKIWVTWPGSSSEVGGQAGGCVLSERDGVSTRVGFVS